jgi:hypothetical protein
MSVMFNPYAHALRFFNGIANWIIPGNGKIYASETGNQFLEVDTQFFSGTNVNKLGYSKYVDELADPELYAAADDGLLAKSTDGYTWTTVNAGTTDNLKYFSGGGENIVGSGKIWTSIDSTFGATSIMSIAYGGPGRGWVSCGRSSTVRHSTDGITWNTVSAPFSWSLDVYSNDSMYVIAGGTGSSNGSIGMSTDGITWSAINSLVGGTNNAVTHGDGMWIVVGGNAKIRRSTDAITWVESSSLFGSSTILTATWGNGLFIVGGRNGQVRRSTDGITWATSNASIGTSIYSSAYGNGIYVIGGSANGDMRISSNGTTWTSVVSGFTGAISAIAYGDGKWLAGAGAQLMESTDAVTWTTAENQPFIGAGISKIRYEDSVWMISGSPARIHRSEYVSKQFRASFIAGGTS